MVVDERAVLLALLDHVRDAADVRGHVPSQPVGTLFVKLEKFAELNKDDVDVAQQLSDVVTDDSAILFVGGMSASSVDCAHVAIAWPARSISS
jgi:hypothetical protein